MAEDKTVFGTVESVAATEALPPTLLVTLEVLEGPDKGARFGIKKAKTVIGRKQADVALTDPTVSGKHAFIEYAGGKLFVTDNNSTNGTEVNGQAVESSPLGNMDEIRLGDTKLLISVVEDKFAAFTDEPEEAPGEQEDTGWQSTETTRIKRALPNPPLVENLHIVLEVMDGPDNGKKFEVKNRSTVVGRGEKADFRLTDPTVSKQHFQLEVHNKDKMTVKDLASSNGTRLNDRYISAVKMRHGDVVRAGDTSIRLLIHVKK